jgi:hypothetical protein
MVSDRRAGVCGKACAVAEESIRNNLQEVQ